MDPTELLVTLCPTPCTCSACTHSVPVLVLCITAHISTPPSLSSDPACWDALEKWDTPGFRVGPGSDTYTQRHLVHFLQLWASGSPRSVGHNEISQDCYETYIAQYLAPWRPSKSMHFSPQCLAPFTGLCLALAGPIHLLPACLPITDTSPWPRLAFQGLAGLAWPEQAKLP